MLKCIVWDLDDTLWRGTLRGGDELAINEAAVAAVRAADAAGIVQSVASRNEPDAARIAMEELGILPFFVYPQIALAISKTAAISAAAKRFNLGLDSVAFVDDNPFEIYEVNRYLPEVMTYQPNEIPRLMQMIEDARTLPHLSDRRALMERREARLNAAEAFRGRREDFLKECQMVLRVRPAMPGDLDRITELIFRTNRLNNTRQRDVQPDEYIADPDKRAFCCELTDIFGDHGLVGAALFELDEHDLRIDFFCVSCRIEGRGIGAGFLRASVEKIASEHPRLRRALCPYKINAEDKAALVLLKLLGFRTLEKKDDELLMACGIPMQPKTIPWIKII